MSADGGRGALLADLSLPGWLCILHFGPNSRESRAMQLIGAHGAPTLERYPFFRFSYAGDPYTFQLTFLATLAIWVSRQSDP